MKPPSAWLVLVGVIVSCGAFFMFGLTKGYADGLHDGAVSCPVTTSVIPWDSLPECKLLCAQRAWMDSAR